jgi:hypothetical protein
MATDAIVLEHDDNVDLGTSMTPIVQLAPLQPGKSYVIWAKASVFASNSVAKFELEAFGAKDEVEISFSGHQGEASFSLVVATTLPADAELFTVAKLSGGARVFAGSPATGLSVAKNAKLVVLAIDSVAVQAA